MACLEATQEHLAVLDDLGHLQLCPRILNHELWHLVVLLDLVLHLIDLLGKATLVAKDVINLLIELINAFLDELFRLCILLILILILRLRLRLRLILRENGHALNLAHLTAAARARLRQILRVLRVKPVGDAAEVEGVVAGDGDLASSRRDLVKADGALAGRGHPLLVVLLLASEEGRTYLVKPLLVQFL